MTEIFLRRGFFMEEVEPGTEEEIEDIEQVAVAEEALGVDSGDSDIIEIESVVDPDAEDDEAEEDEVDAESTPFTIGGITLQPWSEDMFRQMGVTSVTQEEINALAGQMDTDEYKQANAKFDLLAEEAHEQASLLRSKLLIGTRANSNFEE